MYHLGVNYTGYSVYELYGIVKNIDEEFKLAN